jgi:hypothetical protein
VLTAASLIVFLKLMKRNFIARQRRYNNGTSHKCPGMAMVGCLCARKEEDIAMY